MQLSTEIEFKVDFNDCDPMRIVWHGNYINYFERARCALLDKIGYNYIDMESMILRKGSVSAKAGEILLIPMNMRDGSLLCVGKGNQDWNCSAPHGAGRLMSRSEAKASVGMDEVRKSMEGIYTTSVSRDTIDESPMAYKPMDEIVKNISDTAEIRTVIRPVYNFKAGGE